MDIHEINQTIEELKSGETNWKNCEKLSILLNIRDEIEGGQRSNANYSRKSNRSMPTMYSGSNKSGSDGLTKDEAESWVSHMENADGTTGQKWSLDDVKKIMAQRGIGGSPLDFWAALNATYSDMCKVFKKYGINNLDAYVDFAKAFWMDDADAVPDKLLAYYNSVVQH